MTYPDVEILRSKQDRSINIVESADDGGAIESRLVQRTEDAVIVYLSSSTGCKLACRFCHLTQSRQVMDTPVTVEGYFDQARRLLQLALEEKRLDGVGIVHFNFMARGDALNNTHFVNHTEEIIKGLDDIAAEYYLEPKFKISTIFPVNTLFGADSCNMRSWVLETLTIHPGVEFYYSLYSLNPSFRKRWIPKSVSPEYVGQIFKSTTNKVRLHHALINGENCSIEDIMEISRWLIRHDIRAKFNLVRYNPYDNRCGEEPLPVILDTYMSFMKSVKRITGIQTVSRVGNDVKASCGMFVE